MKQEDFSRYEIARILGARALQIAMNAPLLLKLNSEELEKAKYDPLKIAELEFEADVLPITIKRPLPEKKEAELRREREKPKTDEEKQKLEEKEEEEIEKEGEIMELARPDDDEEEISKDSREDLE